MSAKLEWYKGMLKDLQAIRDKNLGNDSQAEYYLLDDMDKLWYQMNSEDRAEANKMPGNTTKLRNSFKRISVGVRGKNIDGQLLLIYDVNPFCSLAPQIADCMAAAKKAPKEHMMAGEGRDIVGYVIRDDIN